MLKLSIYLEIFTRGFVVFYKPCRVPFFSKAGAGLGADRANKGHIGEGEVVLNQRCTGSSATRNEKRRYFIGEQQGGATGLGSINSARVLSGS